MKPIIPKFPGIAWSEERKAEHRFQYRYYHVCCQCGLRSRSRLIYAHPSKDGMICVSCRAILWGIQDIPKSGGAMILDKLEAGDRLVFTKSLGGIFEVKEGDELEYLGNSQARITTGKGKNWLVTLLVTAPVKLKASHKAG